VPITFAAVLVALAATGMTSAWIGANPMLRPTLRVVIGGGLALGVTFLVGTLLGTSGIV
jgi:VIT1/CCC1 family predicted Fe2+/Mn2+ transporter